MQSCIISAKVTICTHQNVVSIDDHQSHYQVNDHNFDKVKVHRYSCLKKENVWSFNWRVRMSVIAEIKVNGWGVVFAMRTDGNIISIFQLFIAISVFACSSMDLWLFVTCWKGIKAIKFLFIELSVIDALDANAVQDAGNISFRTSLLFLLMCTLQKIE